jgi:hypothetical protein
MSDLLKEAIADAKAIREVAIQNAKATLAETFAPQIKKMVMEEMDKEEDLYEEETDELDAMMKEMEMADDELKEEDDVEDMGEEEESEFDEEDELSEILKELETYEEGESEEDEPIEEDLFLELDEEEMAAPAKKEAPVVEPEDSQLEQFIREMIAEIEGEGEEVPTEGYGAKDDAMEAMDKEMEEMKYEMEEKEKELQEAYKAIKYLRAKINESLLINSKLLYSGKLFRAHNLDENQKISILESFDRATTIRETKLLYASLATTLNELKSNVNSKSYRLKESRASKSTLASTKPAQKVLEENKMVSRLQQLAGIIK